MDFNIKMTKNEKQNLDKKLRYAYATSLKDNNFSNLVKRLKLKEIIAYKYTSKLERTVTELINCENCKGIAFCKNPCSGFVYYPSINEESLVFSYVACKYKKKIIENKSNSIYYELPYEVKNATLKDIDLKDKNRAVLIKWLKEFYDNYELGSKGLYLHGSFGSGKSYLIMAILNELSKKNYKVVGVYYPFLLRNLKENFNDNFKDRIDFILNADILLLDDIGAENNTSWARDEILGTILQYRMDNKKTTFLTSNLTIKDLETHLGIAKGETDKIKARRIIERIKYLTTEMQLISENRRK